MAYVDIVKTEKKYIPNVVILINGTYYAIRNPDSGLTIPAPYKFCVASLVLNPTSIDIKRVNTTIASYSFRLVDLENVLTALITGNAANFMGQEVRIWLGRNRLNSNESEIPFSDYFELPKTRIKKVEHSDNSYQFSSNEDTDRINQPIYDAQSGLAVDILAATTTFTMRDSIDAFPSSGLLKVDNEFVSYTSKNNGAKTFLGVVRGELNSIPADHSSNVMVYHVQTITDNPLNIILRLLISNGGGGAYDNLQDGCGLLNSLIDITGIEELRDTLFIGAQFKLIFYNIPSALKYIETEILQPCNLRFTYSKDSKLTLVILDRAVFVEESDLIDNDSITKYPKWSIDDSKIINSLKLAWDFDEGTNQFRKNDIVEDAASIASYARRPPLSFSFKGIQSSLDGQNFINDFAQSILGRLGNPVAEVNINTHMDKSLQTIGDKALIRTGTIPATDGTLNFANEMEIVERAINFQTGDVSFKLAFTSFTGIRSGYIAPSDLITSFSTQKKVNVAAGRTAQYLVGWYMFLWDEVNQVYMSDAPNKIVGFEVGSTNLLTENGDKLLTEDGDYIILEESSTEDAIIFENDWTTLLSSGTFRIRFANYNESVDQQKRYCYLSNSGADFDDGKQTYRITY